MNRCGRGIDRESVFEEVLVAVTPQLQTTGEIVQAVRVGMGRIVPHQTVRTALERAVERGAAVMVEKRFESGHMRCLWREPIDALSEGMSGSGDPKTPSVRSADTSPVRTGEESEREGEHGTR